MSSCLPFIDFSSIEYARSLSFLEARCPVHVDGEEVLALIQLPGRQRSVQSLLNPPRGVGNWLHWHVSCSTNLDNILRDTLLDEYNRLRLI